MFLTLCMSGQGCEYAEYFRLTDLAKQQFHSKNYKDAIHNFKLGFGTTDFPLGHDLSFALIAANETKDDILAGLIAEKLSKGGVPLRYFMKYKKEKWYGKLEREFTKHKEYYTENFKPELKDKFNSLIKRDAVFARKTMDWYYGTIEMSAENASLEANAIFLELKELTNEYGFPSEHNMGYNYVRRLNRVENYTNTLPLLVHIYKDGERVYENEIPNYICNGILHPGSQQILKQSTGFGNNMGIEHEMKIRQEMYNKKKKNE